ncbi:uncharacterized protein [Eleutherodactylus coqui]|nr:hypothetical protein GDO78_007488 [Eleutherodactylus coqui]KAG9487718.1 hypothetical protein GDO78_007488 [Eleutherodactylus coqui]
MPVCWINGCKFIPGRFQNGHEIKLHSFPNSLERIKEWLLQLGQTFNDIDNIAKQVYDSKLRKSNKFRLCSRHFSDVSFIVNAGGRTLRPNALPTIFEDASHTSEKIHENLSLRKTFKRKREEKIPNEATLPFVAPSQNPSPQISPKSIKSEVLDDYPLYTPSTESSVVSCSISNKVEKAKSYQDAETQTEFTFKNSIIYLLDSDLLKGIPAIDPCNPPYLTLQNPIMALNCFINGGGRPS